MSKYSITINQIVERDDEYDSSDAEDDDEEDEITNKNISQNINKIKKSYNEVTAMRDSFLVPKESELFGEIFYTEKLKQIEVSDYEPDDDTD
jgi:hypothetical protein